MSELIRHREWYKVSLWSQVIIDFKEKAFRLVDMDNFDDILECVAQNFWIHKPSDYDWILFSDQVEKAFPSIPKEKMNKLVKYIKNDPKIVSRISSRDRDFLLRLWALRLMINKKKEWQSDTWVRTLANEYTSLMSKSSKGGVWNFYEHYREDI